MARRLAELATLVDARIVGDPESSVECVDSIERAGPEAITFFADRKLAPQLSHCTAGAVLLRDQDESRYDGNRLLVDDPYAAYATIARTLHPDPQVSAGIHESATIHPGASIDASACIGAQAVIGEGVVIGPRVLVGAGVVIEPGVSIGADTRIGANSVIGGAAALGERCRISAGVVIGESGFGFASGSDGWIGIPQLGSVRIGDDVEVGAQTSIDRGTINDTVIGNGVKLDNQIQVGHNVQIGEHTIVAACVGIAGSAVIGKRCMIAGKAAIKDHVTLADDVVIEAAGVVLKSISDAGRYSSVVSVQESRRWKRNSVIVGKLDELLTRIRGVESQIKNRPNNSKDS